MVTPQFGTTQPFAGKLDAGDTITHKIYRQYLTRTHLPTDISSVCEVIESCGACDDVVGKKTEPGLVSDFVDSHRNPRKLRCCLELLNETKLCFWMLTVLFEASELMLLGKYE